MIHRYTQIPQNQDFYQNNKRNSFCPNLNISKIFCWIFSLTTWISFTFSIYFLNLDYKHENSNTCYILLVISYLIYIIMEFCSSTSKYLRNKKTGQEMYETMGSFFSAPPSIIFDQLFLIANATIIILSTIQPEMIKEMSIIIQGMKR